AMQQDFAPADPQYDDDGEAEQRFQRRPQHTHQAHQLETARDVFGVLAFEALDFRLLLHISANQPRSGKDFLRFGRDVGEHGLDALEALVNLAAKVLHHDAYYGQWQEGEQGKPGADAQHEHQRARGEHHGIGGVHYAGPGQHAHRIQIVGRPRHDVDGARALIKAVRQPLQMGEQVVAQIEFNFARDPDQDPAGEELENGFGPGDRQQQGRVRQQFVACDAQVKVVNGAADDQREENPDPVVAHDEQSADPEGQLVLAEIGEQRP